MNNMTSISNNKKTPCTCPKGGVYSDGIVCEKCGGTEWQNNKKTLAEEFEEKFPQTFVCESLNWGIESDPKPDINTFLTTAQSTIEKRVREATLQEVAEWARKQHYDWYADQTKPIEGPGAMYQIQVDKGYNRFYSDLLTFITTKRQ